MTKPDHPLLHAILNSPAAANWQQKLAASFFDAEARRAVIEQIIVEINIEAGGRLGSAVERLQRTVVAHLVGLASRDASPPPPDTASTRRLTGGELEDRVVREYPYPVAAPYARLTEQESTAAAFGCLLDTFESLLHFLATITVSAYLRTCLPDADCNRLLLDKLVKGAWSTGDLFALLRDTVRPAAANGGPLPYPGLLAYLFTPAGRPSASHRILEAFVALRNRAWGHGTGRDEAFYAGIISTNRVRLEGELAQLDFLTGWELIRPTIIDEAGVVTRADLLMGSHRRTGRVYDLPLSVQDLPANGGDVRAEKTLLLIATDRRQYLPLFPLSLFHFRLAGQGVYFLQRPQWERADGRRQLRKAGYVAYESGLEPHEEEPGEAAVRSLEQHVRLLERQLGEGVGVDRSAGAPLAPDDPDYELPEVRQEQAFHLRTFTGRGDVLADVQAWLDGVEDGYLLLLGPPGQGKSALMAELAQREQQHGGCLLHMVKSHRNPLRFLPSLISQAAKLAGVRLGAGAYVGDVEDLRNTWVQALAAVVRCAGRVVVILDALDELESATHRVVFLPPSLPPGARVVLTCRPDIPLIQELRNRLRGSLEERMLKPLSEADFRLFLERRLEAGGVLALERRLDLHDVFRRLGGNPLFLHCFADEFARSLAANAPGAAAPIDPTTLPATLEAVFRAVYDRVRGKSDDPTALPGGILRARLLQFLCVAREGLTLPQLAELLECCGELLSLEEVRDHVEALSQWLLEVNGRYKPWHQALTDYVLRDVLGAAGVRRVEGIFCNWLSQSSDEAGRYGLRHRPAHLRHTQRWDDLATLLMDLAFLEAKCRAGLVFELADDFRHALRELPSNQPDRQHLRLLEEALLRDIHFIARHPTALFQCLWNTGWWYDCPQAAAHYDLSGVENSGLQPWDRAGLKLSTRLEQYRSKLATETPPRVWIRSLRPPALPLGMAQRAVFSGHKQLCETLAISPDGRWLATATADYATADHVIRVVDSESGSELACLRGHQNRITGVVYSPDGRRLASSSFDQTIRVWDAESWEELFCLEGHEDSIWSVAFSPDGACLASGGGDFTIGIWDAVRGKLSHRLLGHNAPVHGAVFSPDGRRIASGSGDSTVRVWDAASGTQVLCLSGHEGSVARVAFTPDGRHVVSGSGDRTLRVWDTEAGAERGCLHGHQGGVTDVAVSPDGHWVASCSVDQTVRLWDMARQQQILCLRGHEDCVFALIFTPDGRRLASVSRDSTVRLWELDRTIDPLPLRGHTDSVWSVAFSPNGQRAVTGGADQTLQVWDVGSGIRLYCVRAHEAGVTSVAFSHDGHQLVTGSLDRTVRLWNADDATAILVFRGHADTVCHAAFSRDGQRVVSGAKDGTALVWDVTSGKCALRLSGHESGVRRVAFAANGQHIFCENWDRMVRCWDATSGACLQVESTWPDEYLSDAGQAATGWLVQERGRETVIEAASRGEPVAWYPGTFWTIRPHPHSAIWTAISRNELSLFTLEGVGQ